MSHTSVNFIVVNGSAGSISGTAYHHSGSGPGHTMTSLDVSDLKVLCASTSKNTTARSNHDDYWSWKPEGGAESKRLEFNVHKSQQVVLIVTESLLVVVTSERDKVKTEKLAKVLVSG